MEKARMMRKVAVWLLCMLLACTLLPAVAFAEGVMVGSPADGAIAYRGDVALDAQGEIGTQASKPTLILTRAMKTPLTLVVGSSYSLGAKASNGAKVTYISAAPKRVSVSKTGTLNARATGTAVIAASAKSRGGTVKKTVRVRVVPASEYNEVESISADVGAKPLPIGQSRKIVTTITPVDASNKNLVYKCLTPKVASVDAAGKITAKGAGTAKVRVESAANPEAKCTVQVTVLSKTTKKLKDYTWAELKASPT